MRVGYVLLVAGLLLQCSRSPQKQGGRPVFSSLPDSVINIAADSLCILGAERHLRRDYDSALFYFEAALSLSQARGYDDLRTAYTHFKAGRALLVQLKSDAAFHHLENARRIAESNAAPLDSLVAIYLTMSTAKRELLDNASSYSLALHALSLVTQHDPENRDLLAKCHLALGTLHHVSGSYQEAITYYNRSIKLFRDPAVRAGVRFNLAIVYSDMGRYDSSLSYFDRALVEDLNPRTFTSDLKSSVYMNKGFVFHKMGQPDSALYYLSECLTIRKRVWGEKHMLTAGASDALATVLNDLGMLDSALSCRQGTLRAAVREFDDADPFANPRPATDELTMDLVDYLVMKGSAVQKLATRDTLDLQLAALAAKTYLLADSVYSQLLANEVFDDPQLRQLERGRIPYSEMMELTSKMHQETGSREHLDRALHIVERSKAFVLKKALRRLESFAELGISPDLLQKQNRLLAQRSILAQSLMIAQEPSVRDSLGEAIVRLNDSYQEVQHLIEAQRPRAVLNHHGPTVSVDAVMEEMRARRSRWIEYMWCEEAVYIISIDPRGSRLLTIPITTDLVNALNRAMAGINRFDDESISRRNFVRFAHDLHTLYKVLLEPVLRDGDPRSLMISPSGPLMAVPFEALVMSPPDTSEIDFRLPYVVNNYDISYQYSSSLIREFTKRRHGNRMLAVAYSGLDQDTLRSRLADLPGSRAELLTIKEIVTGEENLYLMDEQASEAEFKELAEGFNLLHLAIHGVSDTSSAMKSRLVFAKAGADSEDGNLYAHELYGLDLRNVDLAVLSACESGVGKVQSGEGMMSMARGFAYAGCPSLVISLWKINDRASPEIMADFYGHLSESQSIDKALASAKRDYLGRVNMLNSHPSFWAAFLSVGETEPIDLSTSWTFTYISVLIVLVVGTAVAIVSWRRLQSRATRARAGL